MGLVKLQLPLPNFICCGMLQRTLPAGCIAPCLPTKTDKLPSGGQWLHEIKHDGAVDRRPRSHHRRHRARFREFCGAVRAIQRSGVMRTSASDCRAIGFVSRALLGSAVTVLHRDLIIALAARHALPAVYPGTYFVSAGGLISYSADSTDPHRRAAGYVDRILKGDKPANLPVQNPVKYELAVNLKTAKALGLKIPDRLVAIADEVVE